VRDLPRQLTTRGPLTDLDLPADESGCHPQRWFGRFENAGALTFALALYLQSE
jgi:hypothetical protein